MPAPAITAPSAPSEGELLERARQLDRVALAAIYAQYRPALQRYCARILGEPLLAEECVAETFSRFLAALHNGGGPRDHLQAYLYRVAKNLITDHFASTRPDSLEEDVNCDPSDLPDDQVHDRMEQDEVRLALATLPDDQRRVVTLRIIEGWKERDVAEAMGTTPAAVRSLAARALVTLERPARHAGR